MYSSRHIFLPLAVLCMCCALSCVAERDLCPDVQEVENFCLELVPTQTRTVVDGQLAVSWVDGDSVRVSHSPSGAQQYVDDGIFVYDAGQGLFTGSVTGALTVEGRYDWRVSYPASALPEEPRYVQKGSSFAHLAGDRIPLSGALEDCPAYRRPVVRMHQALSAAALTVTNREMDSFVPLRIVFDAGDGRPVTLDLEDASPLSWDSPATYYVPLRPFTAQAGAKAVLQVFRSESECIVTELSYKADHSYVSGELSRAEMALKRQFASADVLFGREAWVRVVKEAEKELECGPYSDRDRIRARADQLVASMREDGSWADINYSSIHQSTWSPGGHIGNIRDLAKAFHLFPTRQYLDAARLALKYWDQRRPVSINWWFNEISVPMTLAPALLLLREGLDKTDLERADRVLSKARLGMTGQNKVWLAGIVLQRGFLMEDRDMVMMAYEDLFSELRLSEDEGIKPDYSFHQHGKILQIGVYGLVFAEDMAKWYAAFKGTSLALQGEKEEILRNYFTQGQDWFLWQGYYDPNAHGRQATPDKAVANASTLVKAHLTFGLPLTDPRGAKYFPYSDYGIYRGESWYGSVRMQSDHLCGFENTLAENMKGYFSSDGALLIRRTGLEYNDIAPVWDWKHIPGTTTYDNGIPLWGCATAFPHNKTPKVFGQVCGNVMVAAMDYNRDGLTARKAWFFFDRGVVCLGADIRMNRGYEVVTTVEQNLLRSGMSQGDGWVSHRGVTYINLGEEEFEVWTGERTGSWSLMCADYDSTPVTKSVFETIIRHGKNPSGASYAYGVYAERASADVARAYFNENVSVVANTGACQAVRIAGVTYTIDWDSCTVSY